MKRYTATHQVRSYELDAFGHVNNAVFLNYLEFARSEYLLQQGLGFNDFLRWNAIPYVIKAQLEFKSSARVHDVLEIHGEIPVWRRIGFVIHNEIINQTSGKLCLLADLTFAFVNRDEKPVPVPDEFRRAME
ncbi:acyl-CoA thioesterase [candidate division KSB1 bacterium]|nr:acyl-CoA thioesterase [candidate division KSB1 bacterium]